MASGLPDFYRGVDVKLQALSELTARLKNGTPTSSAGNKVVASLGRTSLLSVTGKGMIYGGLVFLNHTSTQKAAEVIQVVDGDDMVSLTFDNLNLLSVDKVGMYPLVLRRYDEVNFIYCVGLGSGITFETSFEVVYNELNTTTPTVFTHLLYALI